jgi:hypothetical protein
VNSVEFLLTFSENNLIKKLEELVRRGKKALGIRMSMFLCLLAQPEFHLR